MRSTNSKPIGIAKDDHTYKLLLLLWKLRVLGALSDSRQLHFRIDDGTGFLTREEIRRARGLV